MTPRTGVGGARVLVLSVTEAGRERAGRLPWERAHGRAGPTVRERWAEVDAFVLFLATGAAVRIVAPLLGTTGRDPGVVCVDEAGRFAVSLCGGHRAGANALAVEVAGLLDAQPVVTTATDAVGLPALDTLPGFGAEGDLAAVTAAVLDGRAPEVANELGWPLPSTLVDRLSAGTGAPGPERLVVTDRAVPAPSGTAVLHPPSLVAGIGTSTGAPAALVASLLTEVLLDAGLAHQSVAEVATIDRRREEPAVVALGHPVRTFTAAQLATVAVPTPSPAVAAAVGTPSVAEAAALLAAGAGAQLLVPKRANAVATVALARRARPRGHLALVGLGPGHPGHRTPAAVNAVRSAELVIGYSRYVDHCADLLSGAQEVVRSPIGEETVRAKQALAEAAAGRRVAVVCSGDPGVYAMASLVLDLAAEVAPEVDVEVVPGVTAALAAAAVLGAPLGHDHAVISLSDLLTPWEAIARRLQAAADADLVVCLYNPRSAGRSWQLGEACRILAAGRPPTVPVGVVTDASRPGEHVLVTTLADLDHSLVGMTTCLIVGASTTRVVGGRMVTPRGYTP